MGIHTVFFNGIHFCLCSACFLFASCLFVFLREENKPEQLHRQCYMDGDMLPQSVLASNSPTCTKSKSFHGGGHSPIRSARCFQGDWDCKVLLCWGFSASSTLSLRNIVLSQSQNSPVHIHFIELPFAIYFIFYQLSLLCTWCSQIVGR